MTLTADTPTAAPASPLPPALSQAADDLARDGAAVLRQVLPAAWIERLRGAIERQLAADSPTAAEYGRAAGRFHGDFFLWLRDEDFRAIALDSPLPRLAAGLTGSRTARLFYDQLFVKEPGAVERTPWHQDLPYWPVAGRQVVSLWVPFDPVGPENGVVTYVRGSHLWGRTFRPKAFDEANAGAFAASPYEPMPDIDGETAPEQRLTWRLAPGDVLAHLGLTIHGAAGNSTSTTRRRALALRYTGDDARYDPRPGTFMDMASVRAHIPAPGLEPGEPMGGPLFPPAWEGKG